MNRTLAGLCLAAALLARVAGAQAEPTAKTDDKLGQMTDIEARIEALEARQAEQGGALRATGRSLEETSALMNERDAAREEGAAWLDSKDRERAAALDRLRASRLEARMDLDTVRADAKRIALARLALPGDADPAMKLGLILADRRNRSRAQLAGRTLKQLDAEAKAAGEEAEAAEKTRGDYSAFADMSLSALREKHARLAGELRALQEGATQRDTTIARLEAQREDLKTLVEKLAKEAPAPTPTPDAQPAATPDTKPEATPAPEAATPAMAVNTQSDGARRLFWHASRVGVRALAEGNVVFTGPYAGYRHLLIVDHGGGWRALYGNMTHCKVVVGQKIAQGAELGDYRAAAGRHVEPFWFEMRRGAEPVEPDTWPALGADWERRLFQLP